MPVSEAKDTPRQRVEMLIERIYDAPTAKIRKALVTVLAAEERLVTAISECEGASTTSADAGRVPAGRLRRRTPLGELTFTRGAATNRA